MNAIRATRELNKRELDLAVPPSASWHVDYRDTAYVYIGGLPLDLSEGDVLAIFSQYGNPTHLNLVRDRDTGKSRGFAFLKYEDQRSCDLAVDNLGGAEVLGRLLRVDHSRYKKKEGEDEDTWRIERLEGIEDEAAAAGRKRGSGSDSDDDSDRRKKRRRRVKEEQDRRMIKSAAADDEDPMKDYLDRVKKEDEEELALVLTKSKDGDGDREHSHRHRHHHRSRREREGRNDDDDNDDSDSADQRRRRSRRDREYDETKPRRYTDAEERADGHRSSHRSKRDGATEEERSRRRRDRHNDDGSEKEDRYRHRRRDRVDSEEPVPSSRDRYRDRDRDRDEGGRSRR